MSNPGLISALLSAMKSTEGTDANAFAYDLLRVAEDIETPFSGKKRQGRITICDPGHVLDTETSLFTFDEIKVERQNDATVLTLGATTLVLESISGGTDGEYTTLMIVEDCGDPIGVPVDVRLERAYEKQQAFA